MIDYLPGFALTAVCTTRQDTAERAAKLFGARVATFTTTLKG